VLLGQQLYCHVRGAPSWCCIDVWLNDGPDPVRQ
jgi:hypothetical protein